MGSALRDGAFQLRGMEHPSSEGWADTSQAVSAAGTSWAGEGAIYMGTHATLYLRARDLWWVPRKEAAPLNSLSSSFAGFRAEQGGCPGRVEKGVLVFSTVQVGGSGLQGGLGVRLCLDSSHSSPGGWQNLQPPPRSGAFSTQP